MNKTILIISNFLSLKNNSYSVCQSLANQLMDNGWEVITTSNKKNRLLRLIHMLITILTRRHSYQIAQVDVFSGPAFLWAEMSCMLLELLGKPYVLTLHGGNLPNFANRNPYRVKRLLNQASIVTVPSEYLKTAMNAFCHNLVLLPNPIDIRCYPFQMREQVQPNLIWLRAFHKIYNPELAIHVIHKLQIDFSQVHLIMVGPDKGDGSLQRTVHLAEKLGVKEQVEFIAGVNKSDVPEWLNKGDIFLNTTNIDNTPVSVMEAMACGLCVVSTNVGGVPYLLAHEQDGLLVSPDDPDQFVVAIRRLMTDSNLTSNISKNARIKVEQFDLSVILPRWEKLFNSLI